jgi:hypothetical protein
MMNGASHATNGRQVLDAQASAFADQLSTLFRNQASLHELTNDRIRTRLDDFGIRTHATRVRDYFDRCVTDGWDAKRGFVDFLLSIGEGLDEHAAQDLWNTSIDLDSDQHPSDYDIDGAR